MSKQTVYSSWFVRLIILSIGSLFLITGIQTYAQSCTQWAGGTIASGQSVWGYSTTQWAITGQDYPNGCTPFSGKLTCINGVIAGGPALYKYTLSQCQSLTPPKSCLLTGFAGFTNGISKLGYSATGAFYPQTCADIQTTLKCVNGNINGNWQAYSYPSCTPIGGLTAGTDIGLEASATMQAQGDGTMLSQGSSPTIALSLKNQGTTLINTDVPAGFVTCKWLEKNITIYTSPAIPGLVINPGTKIAFNIKLSSLFTQSLGNKTASCTFSFPATIPDTHPWNNTWSGSFEIVASSRFDIAMEQSINPIKANLEAPSSITGPEGVQNFVFTEVMNIVLPLIVVIGILLSLLGFYKVMFSSEDKAVSDGSRFIIYGVLGIVIIVSAKYIGSSLINILSSSDIQGGQIAQGIYDQIAFPFIKFAMYLILGVMFIIMMSRVVTFIFGTDADAKKKAGTLIGRNIISMLVIIGAKQIVEAVFGKQSDILKPISNLGDIGGGILANKNIPLIYHIINWALGLVSLVLLILIIVQTFQLLFKPDDEKQMTSVKKSLLYMFIGILVLGTGYLIVNFLIVN